mgnify:CR=1 FL=1
MIASVPIESSTPGASASVAKRSLNSWIAVISAAVA